jgi:hypothetical protein
MASASAPLTPPSGQGRLQGSLNDGRLIVGCPLHAHTSTGGANRGWRRPRLLRMWAGPLPVALDAGSGKNQVACRNRPPSDVYLLIAWSAQVAWLAPLLAASGDGGARGRLGLITEN